MATQPLTQPADVGSHVPPQTKRARFWRVTWLILAGLVGVLALAFAVIYGASSWRLNQRYDLAVQPPVIPTDAVSLARGQHLANAVTGCNHCHGADLAGHTLADAPPFLLVASNLTAGAGGVGSRYSDADWVRAIRYGVRPNGKPLLFMPSSYFAKLSDEDLGAIIAYLKSVAPVDRAQEASHLRPLGRLLLLLGEYVLPVETGDVAAPMPTAPPVGRTANYGAYLVAVGGCAECHGPELAGAAPVEPDAAPGANLTPSGNLGHWSEAEFINTLRTGTRPDGTALRNPMPWWVFAQQTDDELGAIYRYLRTLPALPTAGN